jgi:hypothetical protein
MKIPIALLFAVLLLAPVIQAQGLQPELTIMMTRYDPYPAEPGKYMTLWIKLQNSGPVSARNVTLELLDTYPFSLDPGEERVRTFGEVIPTEPILAEYRVRVDTDALDGRNPIDLKIGSDGRDFFIKGFDIYVESKAVDFALGSILSEPESLYSDTENNKLTIAIQNVGESAAKLVRAELMLPDGFSPSESYSDEYSAGNIEAESSGDVIFYIDIDSNVRAGEHPATLKVSYKDGNDGDYKKKTLQVRIPVRASPSFEITGLDISPRTLGQGSEGVEMKLDILNSGTREAENVNVRVLKEATQPFDFDEKSDFVGNLKPNETGQAVFHFDVDANADLKKYILDIEVRYTQDSTVKIANDEIQFIVTEPLPDMTGIYIFLILMLVVVAGAFWYYKR